MKLEDFKKGMVIAIVISFIILFTYAHFEDKHREKEYKKYIGYDVPLLVEHYQRMYDTNVNKKEAELVITSIVKKKLKNKSLTRMAVNSCKTGFGLGCISGFLTGGPSGALAMGIILSFASSAVTVVGESTNVSDDLKCIRDQENIVKKTLKIK